MDGHTRGKIKGQIIDDKLICDDCSNMAEPLKCDKFNIVARNGFQMMRYQEILDCKKLGVFKEREKSVDVYRN